MDTQDYYEILGLSRPSAGTSESDFQTQLKKAYRKRARSCHPDRNDTPGAKEEFQKVQKAYEVLSDAETRRAYDQLGHAGFEQYNTAGGGPTGSAGFGDMGDVFSDLGGIFGDLFGGGRGGRGKPSGRQHGADLRYELALDLEDAVFGCSPTIQIPRLGRCKSCEGTGAQKGTSPVVCRSCEGAGQVYLQHGPFNIQQTCSSCHGQGRIITKPCSACRGQGQVRETKTLSVKIPAGVDNGDRIRLSGEGEAGIQGGQNGDLYVQIQVRPHALFERKGTDLYCEVPINYTTAVLGGEIAIPTISGSVKAKVPAATQSGKVLRLRGQGIPNARYSTPGDLLCKLVVETVVNLDSNQKELLKKFEDSLQQTSEYYPQRRQKIEAMQRFFSRRT